ncbi:hypothetical protein EW146_g7102 [Bondarzewia mesenterica]|uniref:C2H2-type domain-containing protein n=1 Tax=Bondarzewia mesenterica TaxID=1095465 RepID=A0A4V3XEC5_9AGAM|nr:hypothetical protein EW146_g7102 [Bondarzewia mesenterica]
MMQIQRNPSNLSEPVQSLTVFALHSLPCDQFPNPIEKIWNSTSLPITWARFPWTKLTGHSATPATLTSPPPHINCFQSRTSCHRVFTASKVADISASACMKATDASVLTNEPQFPELFLPPDLQQRIVQSFPAGSDDEPSYEVHNPGGELGSDFGGTLVNVEPNITHWPINDELNVLAGQSSTHDPSSSPVLLTFFVFDIIMPGNFHPDACRRSHPSTPAYFYNRLLTLPSQKATPHWQEPASVHAPGVKRKRSKEDEKYEETQPMKTRKRRRKVQNTEGSEPEVQSRRLIKALPRTNTIFKNAVPEEGILVQDSISDVMPSHATGPSDPPIDKRMMEETRRRWLEKAKEDAERVKLAEDEFHCPYKPGCKSKPFARKSDLRRHVSQTLTHRPDGIDGAYICDACGLSFDRYSSLTRHQRHSCRVMMQMTSRVCGYGETTK